ncbi:uncharacterized protein METZ01_LOCUS319014, partial [marine metagenome]
MRLFLTFICGLFWIESWSTTSAIADSSHELKVTEIRTWEHPDYTRLVLELTSEVRPDIFLISNPYRVVLDLPPAEFLVPMEPRKGVGVIKNYRFGLFEPGISRLVIDLTGPAIVKKSFILPPTEQKPHRFVLDLRATTKEEFLATATGSQIKRNSAPEATENTDITNQENHSHSLTIVLDAGHGGVDPGAIGKNGFYEKTVALAAPKELGQMLQVIGPYKVVLTRNTDIYLPLRQRVAVARRVKGDLFISI